MQTLLRGLDAELDYRIQMASARPAMSPMIAMIEAVIYGKSLSIFGPDWPRLGVIDME